MNVLDTAWAEKRIANAFLYDRVFKVVVRIGDCSMTAQILYEFRGQLGIVIVFDWICVPLVYTQVVNVAVRSYFIVC